MPRKYLRACSAIALIVLVLFGCSDKPSESDVLQALERFLPDEWGNCSQVDSLYTRLLASGRRQEAPLPRDGEDYIWPVRLQVSGICRFEIRVQESLAIPETTFTIRREDGRSDRRMSERFTSRRQIPEGYVIEDARLHWTKVVGSQDTTRFFDRVLHLYMRKNVFDEWYVDRQFDG